MPDTQSERGEMKTHDQGGRFVMISSDENSRMRFAAPGAAAECSDKAEGCLGLDHGSCGVLHAGEGGNKALM